MRFDLRPFPLGATAPWAVDTIADPFDSDVALTRERARLESMISEARAGRSGVAAIHGLPGSGKTYLLDSAVGLAPDFRLVRLPVRSAGEQAGTEWLEFFQLAERELAQVAPPTGFDHLKQSALAAIRASRGHSSCPVLIVLDDCQLAHRRAVRALADAVLDSQLEAPAVFVAAWRDGLDGSTMPLHLDLPTHRLEPLTRDELSGFVFERLGKLPERSVLDRIWRATGGNPSGILAACSSASDEELSGLVPLTASLSLSPDVAEGFGGWTDTLAPDTRLAVVVASAAEMPRAVLEDALADVGLTLEALRPVCDLGLLTIGGEKVHFAHAMCRAAAFGRAPQGSQLTARHAVTRAFIKAGLTEPAALQAAAASGRDDAVAALCAHASQSASRRSDQAEAARFAMLGARRAATDTQAGEHLIEAASRWHAAGQPERAREALQKVSPVNVTPAVLARATYRSARISFDTLASVQSVAEMAAAAEMCAVGDPETAALMLADAAACALMTDQTQDAFSYAQRSVALAKEDGSAREWALGAHDAIAILASEQRSTVAPGQLERVTRLTSAPPIFPCSPQMAYVFGCSLVHIATPSSIGRWLTWMDRVAGTTGDRSLAAALAMVRARSSLCTGNVAEALQASTRAVSMLDGTQNVPLLTRALSWSAWLHACAGNVREAFRTASRFFSLESVPVRGAHIQVLTALAHCELQKGRRQGAHAWLRALEDESTQQLGYSGSIDWPSLPVFLELALLGGYQPEMLDTDVPEESTDGLTSPHLQAWAEVLRLADPAAALQHLDEMFAGGSVSSSLLNAHLMLVSGLRQRELGLEEVAKFNLSRASVEFEGCGAHGWSRLATAQIEAAGGPETGPAAPASPPPIASSEDTADQQATEEREFLGQRSSESALPKTEINLLGEFSVWSDGVPAAIPVGHAAQALKIVALFRRISVDELVEILWPGAEPGVGTRRLRNILWRIKSSSGDILRRSDNFICLEETVVTDVSIFEEAADRAFKDEALPESPESLARLAVSKYGGELLPSDRYADWTAAPREALNQLRLQLLDLMLTQALKGGNRQEAFTVLEDLISADPYEERYYVQLAALHLKSGNRSRMRAAVARGERMLDDLGVEPSRRFAEFVSTVAEQ